MSINLALIGVDVKHTKDIFNTQALNNKVKL